MAMRIRFVKMIKKVAFGFLNKILTKCLRIAVKFMVETEEDPGSRASLDSHLDLKTRLRVKEEPASSLT